jgi:hypothetical protein
MTHKNDHVLSVKELARVEGKGTLYIRARGGRVQEARLDIRAGSIASSWTGRGPGPGRRRVHTGWAWMTRSAWRWPWTGCPAA